MFESYTGQLLSVARHLYDTCMMSLVSHKLLHGVSGCCRGPSPLNMKSWVLSHEISFAETKVRGIQGGASKWGHIFFDAFRFLLKAVLLVET